MGASGPIHRLSGGDLGNLVFYVSSGPIEYCPCGVSVFDIGEISKDIEIDLKYIREMLKESNSSVSEKDSMDAFEGLMYIIVLPCS